MGIINKHKDIIAEIIRFSIVGVICSLVNYGILWLFVSVVFHHTGDKSLITLSSIIGFAISVLVNYSLSIWVVFKKAEQRKNGMGAKAAMLYFGGAIVGLLINSAVMWFGQGVFGSRHYSIIWVGATIIVMIWNYLSRKFLIFH